MTGRENALHAILQDGKAEYIPSMADFEMIMPTDVVRECPPYALGQGGSGYDYWGCWWEFEADIGGASPLPGREPCPDITEWKEKVKFCESHGVDKIALELHPGFMCYNPTTLLRLRDAVGSVIGANLDPSHLFWQGIEITEAIKLLGKAGAIHHFHAKDTRIDSANVATRGVLDTESLSNLTDRSWIFRTVGYGHDAKVWKDIFSILQSVGYKGAISIEHEDGLMSPLEGLEKAIDFLKPMIIRESAGAMWWA